MTSARSNERSQTECYQASFNSGPGLEISSCDTSAMPADLDLLSLYGPEPGKLPPWERQMRYKAYQMEYQRRYATYRLSFSQHVIGQYGSHPPQQYLTWAHTAASRCAKGEVDRMVAQGAPDGVFHSVYLTKREEKVAVLEESTKIRNTSASGEGGKRWEKSSRTEGRNGNEDWDQWVIVNLAEAVGVDKAVEA